MVKAAAKKPAYEHHNKGKNGSSREAVKSADSGCSSLHAPVVQRKPVCPCGGDCPRCTGTIQTKLKIGQPNDIYEQEADRVAEQVMRMPGPRIQMKPT